MRAKQFFYVCAGILMLAIAYPIGASRAQSQSTTDEVAGVVIDDQCYDFYVVTRAGDVYLSQTDGCGRRPFQFVGNVFGATVQTEDTSITDVKEKYREEE